MENRPKVSICVPVYNGERYLARFLDSALNQTFDDYEIILADNWSTDDSMKILQRYQKAYPQKVFVYRTDIHAGAGKGRNLAFQKSKGRYIYWCDADDLIHPFALEKMYNEAIRYKADIVRACAMRMDEEDGDVTNLSKFSYQNSSQASNDALIMSGTYFWLDMIERDLIEKVGPMPEEYILEDVRYLTRIHSYAKRIRFLEFPVYYWSRRGFSTTFTIRKELCKDAVECDKYALEHCNPKHIQAVQYLATARTVSNLNIYWPYFDYYIEAIYRQAWIPKNDLIRADNGLMEAIKWAMKLAHIHFPNIIYVDGFNTAPSKARLEELEAKVFHDGSEIVILTEKTCDVNENEYIRRAYNRGNLSLVAGYFALKNIYERGGVFIHNNIRILNYFSCMKYQNAFFSLVDKNTYSEWIYGAPARNEVIASILQTFSEYWDKNDDFMSVSKRISVILTGKYNIPQDGRARLWGDPVSVLSTDISIADTHFSNQEKLCAFEHDFSACAGEEGYITLPRNSLRSLMESTLMFLPEKSPREIEMERELADMKQTNTYKLMMQIRKIGDGPAGPLLKKIFHKLLQIWGKFKR